MPRKAIKTPKCAKKTARAVERIRVLTSRVPFRLPWDTYTMNRTTLGYEVRRNSSNEGLWISAKSIAAWTLEIGRTRCDDPLCLFPSEIDEARIAGVDPEVVYDIVNGWTDCNDILCGGRCYLQQGKIKARERRLSALSARSNRSLRKEIRKKPLDFVDLTAGWAAPEHVHLKRDRFMQDHRGRGIGEPAIFAFEWNDIWDETPSGRTQLERDDEFIAPDAQPMLLPIREYWRLYHGRLVDGDVLSVIAVGEAQNQDVKALSIVTESP